MALSKSLAEKGGSTLGNIIVKACCDSSNASGKLGIDGWSNPYQKRISPVTILFLARIAATIPVATASESETIGAQSGSVSLGSPASEAPQPALRIRSPRIAYHRSANSPCG